MYRKYGSVKRIATELSVSDSVIDRILRENRYRIDSNNKKTLDIPNEEILRLYKERTPIKEIAKMFNCNQGTILSRLRDLKGKLKKQSKPNTLPRREIRQEFRRGKSVNRLVIDYSTTPAKIKELVSDLIEE